jgi:hypothetical protein
MAAFLLCLNTQMFKYNIALFVALHSRIAYKKMFALQNRKNILAITDIKIKLVLEI